MRTIVAAFAGWYLVVVGGLFAVMTLAGVVAWLLPAATGGPLRGPLLAAGPAHVPSRRELPAMVLTHFRAYGQRRSGLHRLATWTTLPWVFALLALGRVMRRHVTLTTGDALAMVTRLPGSTGWMFHTFARRPGTQRGAAQVLPQQVIRAAGGKRAPLRLNAANPALADYYRLYGFRPAPTPRAARRMVLQGGDLTTLGAAFEAGRQSAAATVTAALLICSVPARDPQPAPLNPPPDSETLAGW